MDPYEVGTWRFCPACGRPSTHPDGNWPDERFEAPDCGCCGRPWEACPCTPATEGKCKSQIG